MDIKNLISLPYPNLIKYYKNRRVAWWLATCARKPKVPGSSPVASYGKGELSAVIARLMSKCL